MNIYLFLSLILLSQVISTQVESMDGHLEIQQSTDEKQEQNQGKMIQLHHKKMDHEKPHKNEKHKWKKDWRDDHEDDDDEESGKEEDGHMWNDHSQCHHYKHHKQRYWCHRRDHRRHHRSHCHQHKRHHHYCNIRPSCNYYDYDDDYQMK